ncbi:integrator complex subunit 9-like [Daphnia carinata]|uniref:integrator complex subunit 9-like n=1 Tax=Daphnia carinata TaxID=120202 RepID=UPI00257F3E80|nr:integrator complex subunit 9-like [Daphnia carinata]
MKIYSLGANPNKPCNILNFKGVSLMLDCGLDINSALHFLPLPLVASKRLSSLPNWIPKDAQDAALLDGELKECENRVLVDGPIEILPPQSDIFDISNVDTILLSNHACMLALPFITEETGFKGRVYATEPTLQIGRLYMEELVHYLERTPKTQRSSRWKQVLQSLPPPLNAALRPNDWRKVYSMKAINAALAKVRMVGFNEKIDICGALTVMAVSSGYSLGSCNWIIHSGYEKIAYVSASSTLTTHPRPMDQVALRNADLLILTALTQTPVANPDSMLGEFCMAVAATLRSGGSCLVPCHPSGLLYDLFECLSVHLDNIGLSQIPLFFFSPVAETSLAYSNIFAEWLSSGKQSKVYLPEEPFPHAHLIKNGRLKHFPSLHAEGFTNEYRQPCVVFCGHPSLRFGNVVHFIELWGNHSNHSIVFVEPDFPYLEALAPYQPLTMKIVHCPIDTSLSFTQANKLIRDLKPGNLLVPDIYLHPPVSAPLRSDLVIQELEPPALGMKSYQVLQLPIKRKQEKVHLDPALASRLEPIQFKTGLSASTLTGKLDARDNKFTLKVLNEEEGGTLYSAAERMLPRHPWGSVDTTQLLHLLSQHGLLDARVEDTPRGVVIHLPREDTVIQLEGSNTHVYCHDEALRRTLRDILLQCLPCL